MTTLIKNGTVVTSTGRHDADVLIDGEKIAAICNQGLQQLQVLKQERKSY